MRESEGNNGKEKHKKSSHSSNTLPSLSQDLTQPLGLGKTLRHAGYLIIGAEVSVSVNWFGKVGG